MAEINPCVSCQSCQFWTLRDCRYCYDSNPYGQPNLPKYNNLPPYQHLPKHHIEKHTQKVGALDSDWTSDQWEEVEQLRGRIIYLQEKLEKSLVEKQKEDYY